MPHTVDGRPTLVTDSLVTDSPLTDLVVVGAELVAVALLVRVGAALLLAALARLWGRRGSAVTAHRLAALAGRVGPGLSRGAVAAVAGGTLTLGAVTPAAATGAETVPVLDRVPVTAESDPAPSRWSAPWHVHEVRPGESLWSIAAAELLRRGRPAEDADVARRWPRWYALNRAAVGPDPRLLQPGTVLRAPGVRR